MSYPFLCGPTPLEFAHRGAAPDGLENSMAAFERAVRLGYRYLETDVRISRDGVLVAFHDPTLRRTTGRPGLVATLRWAELARARIGGREPIPRLEDVLGAWSDVRINLDIKVSAAIPALAEAVRRTGTVDRVCIGSFSDSRLVRMRAALGPRLATSLGPREVLALRRAAAPPPPPPSAAPAGLARARLAATRLAAAARLAAYRQLAAPFVPAGVPCVQVPPRVGPVVLLDSRFVAAAHRRGLQVHAWTINDPAEMTRLLDLGVDGIMTDRAELLRDILVDRGQWHGR